MQLIASQAMIDVVRRNEIATRIEAQASVGKWVLFLLKAIVTSDCMQEEEEERMMYFRCLHVCPSESQTTLP